MFCGKCGNEIKQGNSFCVKCGERVDMGNQAINPISERYADALKKLIANALAVSEHTELCVCGINISVKDVTQNDLLQFCFYLCAADDEVTYAETDFINCCFGYNFAPNTLEVFIKENGDFGTVDEPKIPTIFEIMFLMDIVIKQDMLACKAYLYVFSPIGTALHYINDKNGKKEKAHNRYMSMLERFVQDKSQMLVSDVSKEVDKLKGIIEDYEKRRIEL